MTTNKFIIIGNIFLLASAVLFFGFDFIAFAISKLTLNPNFGGLSIIYLKMVLSALGALLFLIGIIKEFTKTPTLSPDLESAKRFKFHVTLGVILMIFAFYTFFMPYYSWHSPLLKGTIYG